MTRSPGVFAHPAFAGRIGIAREEITPPTPIYARNWGAAMHDYAEGVHRPLTLTALAVAPESPDGLPLVLLAADLGWWRAPRDEQSVRGGILDALGLPEERLMLALSHTHAGPSICAEDDQVQKSGGFSVSRYLSLVRETAIRASRRAIESAAPSLLEWCYGRCSLASHRDLPDPAANRVVNGFNPTVPADDTLLVGRVTAMRGMTATSARPAAVIVNYACHPVTLAWQNRLISPDFVGALRELVEREAPGALCLFLQGASGELAPRDEYTGDSSVADSNGRELAYSTLATLEGMLPAGRRLEYAGVVESGAPLAVWRGAAAEPSRVARARTVDVDLPIKDDLPGLSEIEAAMGGCESRAMLERLNRWHRVRRSVGDAAVFPARMWAWRLGDAVLIGHGNEAYSRLQTGLRAEHPEAAICVMNVVNGWRGYLPPEELYDRDIYQVWQTPFARGGLERTIAAALETTGALLSEESPSESH